MPDASQRLQDDEDRVLGTMNRVLASMGAEPLEQVSELYRDVDVTFLTTFPELDHYPGRASPEYCGVWSAAGGQSPAWPKAPGKKVFAYLKPLRALAHLLGLLGQLGCPTVVYLPFLDPNLRRFESATLRFQPERLDLAAVGEVCDLAVLNAGHGTTATMLLSGTPILEIPTYLEQALNARAVARLGAGLLASSDRPDEISSKLIAMLDSDQYAEAARRFATDHAEFDPEQSIRRIVARLEELLCDETTESRTISTSDTSGT
jgi:hypothetical protein